MTHQEVMALLAQAERKYGVLWPRMIFHVTSTIENVPEVFNNDTAGMFWGACDVVYQMFKLEGRA